MTIALPGYVDDVATPQVISPEWGNAIRDRTLQIFASAAARAAALPSPQVGQICFQTDTGTFLVYEGAVVGWRRPWNMPWGKVARTVDNTTATFTDSSEHALSLAATTFTAVANRQYRIHTSGAFRNLNAAVTGCTFRTKDGSTLIEDARIIAMPATAEDEAVYWAVETDLTAGSHTINVTMQSSDAAGISCVASQYPFLVYIEDVGPAGNPS